MNRSATDKTCTSCGLLKPLEEFHWTIRKENGRRYPVSMCKVCTNARRRQRVRDDPEYRRQVLEWQRKSYAKPQVRERRLAAAKARSEDPEFKKQRQEYYRVWRAANQAKIRDLRRQYKPLYRSRAMELYRLHTYGVTQAEFDRLLAHQGERCSICARRFTLDLYPHMDHDHRTGMLRGLLCGSCNLGIGNLRDDPKIARAAAKYLSFPSSAFPAQVALQMMTWSEHDSNVVRSAEQETTDPVA